MIVLFIYTCTHIFLFFFALFFDSEISNLFFCDDEMTLFAIVSGIKHQKSTYFYCFVHNLLIIIDIKFILHAHFSFVTLNGLCGYDELNILMVLFWFLYPLLFTLIRFNFLYFSLKSFFQHTYNV